MSSCCRWLAATVAFIAIISLPFVCNAMDVPLGDRAELLSYNELMKLTPEKREMYLQSVRDLLLELAAISGNDKSEFLVDNAREVEDYIALINFLMPEAGAETKNRPAELTSAALTVPVMTGTLHGKWQKWECPHNLTKDFDNAAYKGAEHTRGRPLNPSSRKIMMEAQPSRLKKIEYNNKIYLKKTTRGDGLNFDYRLGTCRVRGNPGTRNGEPACSEGYELVTGQDSQRKQQFKACVPIASWDALPSFRQREMKSPTGARDARAMFGLRPDGKPNPSGSAVAIGAVGKLRESSVRDMPPGWKIVKLPDGTRVLRAPKPPPPKTAKSVARADGKPAAGDGSDSKQVSAPIKVEPRKETSTDLPIESEASAEAKTPDAPVTEGSQTDTEGNLNCVIRETDCSQIDRNAAKKAFFSEADAGNVDCIFAGNVSQYIDGNKRPGRCQAVYSFSYSNGSPALSCGSYRKIVCNPLIFGVQKDGSAFCVDAKSNATRDCNTASTKETRSADPLNVTTPGIKESWDSFAKGFNSLCKTQGRRQYFCSECNVMSARVYEMRMMVLGEQGCGEAKLADGSRDSQAVEAAAGGTEAVTDKPQPATPTSSPTRAE